MSEEITISEMENDLVYDIDMLFEDRAELGEGFADQSFADEAIF
jgi:hypothetical protein